MSEVAVIHAVFTEVLGQKPDFSSFEDRLEIQKIVYLLGEFGVACGNYPFKWYKHGPYSQRLQNTILEKYNGNDQIVFSPAGENAFAKIKEMMSVPHPAYTDSMWLEAIGSIHYLQKYLHSTLSESEILEKLKSLKPRLDNQTLNNSAYALLHQYSLL